MNAQIMKCFAKYTTRAVLSLAAVLLLFAAGGCATNPEDNDSDIPWNTPQTWESTPAIPGLEHGI